MHSTRVLDAIEPRRGHHFSGLASALCLLQRPLRQGLPLLRSAKLDVHSSGHPSDQLYNSQQQEVVLREVCDGDLLEQTIWPEWIAQLACCAEHLTPQLRSDAADVLCCFNLHLMHGVADGLVVSPAAQTPVDATLRCQGPCTPRRVARTTVKAYTH